MSYGSQMGAKPENMIFTPKIGFLHERTKTPLREKKRSRSDIKVKKEKIKVFLAVNKKK
jgi:hypothetical protein